MKEYEAIISKIDTDKMKSPSFKMVLTGVGKYAYQRPQDGVYVVPVGCLRDQESISCFLSLLMERYDIDFRRQSLDKDKRKRVAIFGKMDCNPLYLLYIRVQ